MRTRALAVAAVDPMTLGVLRPPGDCGVDIARRRRSAAGRAARLRWTVVRVLLRDRGAPAPDAGADRGRDDRRGRAPRLRPRAADARAAHPPREGDPQHLHVAGAERARRRDLLGLARQARAGRAGRAARPAHRVRARAADRDRRRRGCCTTRRCCASSQSVSTRRSTAVLEACAADGIAAGYPLGREYPEHPDGLLVAITERRSKQDIDRLADSTRRAGRRARTCRGAREVGERCRRDASPSPRAPEVPTPSSASAATTIYRELRRGPARRGAAAVRRARDAARAS